MRRKALAVFMTAVMAAGVIPQGARAESAAAEEVAQTESAAENAADGEAAAETESAADNGADGEAADSDESAEESAAQDADPETALDLTNMDQEWTYDASSDSWTLSVVTAVTNPVIADKQGVSVNVPGAYVTGIDTDGDGSADVTAADAGSEAVAGALVIDYEAEITSTNGQVYTAAAAPVIINTGAAGYGSQTNQLAGSTYAAEGYINVACGNRGKQDSYTDEDGNTVYTGDAPDCLVDQKNAVRFVKYNILLGNLPGSVDYFVSTGGSGGGAHAVMLAATSDNEDFYAYEVEAGAVGISENEDGSYSTTVTIDGTDYEISDGVWGTVAYSAITSLAEADMTLAFEYYLDTDYEFGSDFQEQLAAYLSESYMEYINEQELTVDEELVGFDLDGDGEISGTVALTIEYDEEKYADTNGYGGTYLDLYLAEFTENLQWYLDNLDYAEGWTWFDEDGNALSDEAVAAMSSEEKALAFIEGRYAASSGSSEMGGMGGPGGGMGEMGGAGGPGGDMGGFGGNGGPGRDMGSAPDGAPDGMGELPDGGAPDGASDEAAGEADALPDGEAMTEAEALPDEGIAGGMSEADEMPDMTGEVAAGTDAGAEESMTEDLGGQDMAVGTPDAGTTQAAGSSTDSSNYATYEEMLEAYTADVEEVEAGDEFGNNQVYLYNPLNYIGAETTENPTWARIVCGASEGDISMFNSLNLELAWLAAGTDAVIEWQWNGGHVPSEIFGNSLALYVDQMYGEYVDGANTIEKAAAEPQTENGTATEATGTDISSWVDAEDVTAVTVSLADAVSYRSSGASKAVPGFDVIDYGQEDYVFGSTETDARHWDRYLLDILTEHQDTLSELFNAGAAE